MKISWKDLIYIKKGKIRKLVLKDLENPITATEISKKYKKHRSSISRILLDLSKKGLVMCINPKDDRERHYKLTNKGKILVNQLKNI